MICRQRNRKLRGVQNNFRFQSQNIHNIYGTKAEGVYVALITEYVDSATIHIKSCIKSGYMAADNPGS